MALYPSNAVSFGADRVNLSSSVLAEDVNSLYREVVAISQDLVGTSNPTAGALIYSAAWGLGTVDFTTTTWPSLKARLQNIETALYKTYTFSLDIRGLAASNTVQSIDAKTVGLNVKTGAITSSTLSSASGTDGATVTYTGANTFSVGQKVTVTGFTIATGTTLNFVLQTITAVTSNDFTIAAPSVTGVTGTTSGISTSLTIVGDITAVVAGMTVTGTNIASGTKVSNFSGQIVTLDTASTGTVSGSISFTTKGTTSGTGSATAYQTTSLQQWQKTDNTVVASVSPDGNFAALGTFTAGSNSTIGGTLAVTGAATFGGEVTAAVINGGTP